MNNDVELIPVKGVSPTVQTQSDNVIYVPQAHKNKAGIVKEGDGVLIENGVVSLNKQTVEDMIDANKWVSYGFKQNLTEDEKGMARHNIGAGDNYFTGSYYDLTQKPHLNTNNTAGLDYGDEELNDTINLHKISKTGSFNDLKHVPQETIDFAESERQKSKNLCCLKNESATVAGVTMIYDSINQTIELNGTSTGDINIMSNIRNILPIISNSLGKTYSFSILIESGNFSNNFGAYLGSLDSDIWSDRFTIWVNKGITVSSLTFTVSTNNTYDTLFVYLVKGTVVNNLKLKVQIEEGSVATDWQYPYGAIVHENQLTEQLSNPNLLINGDFRVNQRGKTSYTHTGKQYGYTYFVDRWFAWGENPFTFDASTKTLTPNTSNTYNSILSQWIEDVAGILGKTITYSVSTNGTVYSKTLNIPTTLSNNVSLGELPTSFGKIRVWSNNNRLRFDIIVSYNQSIVLNYAKVELGSVATPNSPRPYAEELAMCQRYNVDLIRNTTGYPYVAIGFARNETKLFAVLNLPQAMRVKPTTFVYGGLYLNGSNKVNEQITSSNISFGGMATNGNQISLTVDTTGLIAGQCYALQLRDNGHIGIDAEIY